MPKTKSKNKDKKVTSFCMRCREIRPLRSGSKVHLLISGSRMRRGICSKCGTNTSGMVSKDTPYDIKETKKDSDARKDKKSKKKEENLNKLRKKNTTRRNKQGKVKIESGKRLIRIRKRVK